MKDIKIQIVKGLAFLSVTDLKRLLKSAGATITKGSLPKNRKKVQS